jgi:DNA-directed RNA polymerase subunit H (RpoH/RPB5)
MVAVTPQPSHSSLKGNNPTPLAQVLLPDEKRALLERYRVKDTQLPRIQFNDPVARYYGMSRGQVQRSSRSATTVSPSVCQRYKLAVYERRWRVAQL